MAYKTKQIYPWLYSIMDPLDVFCYLAVGEERALLFDTGFGIFSLPEIIAEITDKPLTVVLGHAHIDHANGAYQFGEVYLHPNDFELCREHTSPEQRDTVIRRLKEAGLAPPVGFDPKSYRTAGTGNLKELNAGMVFDLGGLSFKVIEMPGHTSGSIGLLNEKDRVLLDSDSASEHVWLFLNESLPVKDYIAMLERTRLLDFDTFFWAHSNKPHPKSDIEKYIKIAGNATIEKAEPFNRFPELNPYIYKEDDAEIVINKKALG